MVFWICLYLFIGTIVALIVEHEMNDLIDKLHSGVLNARGRKAAKVYSSILCIFLWPMCAMDAVRIVLAKMKGEHK